MTNDSNPDTSAAQLGAPAAARNGDAQHQAAPASIAGGDTPAATPVATHSAIRGFRLGRRLRVRHVRTYAEHGWAYSEGAGREAATVFSLVRCYEHQMFQGWRLTIGRHALWLLV